MNNGSMKKINQALAHEENERRQWKNM